MKRAANGARQLNGGNRGVSILIALLVFFVAALTGIAVLTMATTNAGRYSHARNDQREYLAVASAVKLVRDELSGFSVNVRFEYSESADSRKLALSETTSLGSGLFASMTGSLIKVCERITALELPDRCYEDDESAPSLDPGSYRKPAAEKENAQFSLELEDAAEKVNVALEIDAEAALCFVFSIEGAENSYRTKMTVSPDGRNALEAKTENDATIYTRLFRWDLNTLRIEQTEG